ncbi:hypothetical protein L914_03163 [Phytophthora nicotianae]|uniref:RNase H type-1 domain-containing protein n=1 Tax=Phytophthora nicotianae TaxID=4792 RepID=W2NZG6_PHYNI|nr:hypothetical protein L914_03163 [Phytophthora nicotianae]
MAHRKFNLVDPNKEKMLYIYSDAELLVNSMNDWTMNWLPNGWITTSVPPVKNADLLKLLLQSWGNKRFEHVNAQTEELNWKACWNQLAGYPARNAALMAFHNHP